MDLSSQNVFAKEPVIATAEQKKQKKLILILVFAILGTILVIYFGLSSGEQPASVATVPMSGQEATAPGAAPQTSTGENTEKNTSAASVDSLDLDFSVFDDIKFQSLKLYTIDISGPKGRSNPFVSY